ncbi:MAG TPA: terpene cyclase/mutase family protein [Gemmatales bacterium]|nr:terpene cyclase/mutase family protein [Gemmatales bacterium]HMP59648.1 terpene cyclase/mutase family protein [Gemmatales bacterium]
MKRQRASVLMAMVLALGLATLWPTPQPAAQADVDDQLRARISASVEKAVNYLRKQSRGGMWTHLGFGPGGSYGPSDIGATAMVALALLESDVPASDPLITGAVNRIKAEAPKLTYTYSIAASILLLDRAGGSANASIINSLAGKLIQGQVPRQGGWTYDCPPKATTTDNSNTQFAVLALIVARRHRANVDAALKAAEQRFRQTQNASDGGWSYLVEQPHETTGSMTCTGLLTLIIGFNVKKPARDTRFTGGSAGGGTGGASAPSFTREEASAFLRDPAILKARDYIHGKLIAAGPTTEHVTYFLWSLERVCQVYGWNRLKDVDWYAHGAELLMRNQQADGYWEMDHRHGRATDTAFALLFLRKSNLIPDVSLDVVFRGGGDVRKLDSPRPGATAPGATPTTPTRAQGTEREARDLARELPDSVEPRTSEIIEKLVETSGEWYTEALLDVLHNPATRPTVKSKARDGLARRLSRFRPTTLTAYMQASDKEAKMAAISASVLRHRAKQEVKPVLGDMIELLANTSQTDVAQAAYAALKEITGQDHGLSAGNWKRWLENNP